MDTGDDGRGRWKQIQARLAAAREHLSAGDLVRAAEAVDLALAIDPEFLAARALRERINSIERNPPAAEPPAAVAPTTSAPARGQGLAGLEEKVRQRRIEHRMGTARAALAGGQLGEARAALAEVQELAPDRPELTALNAELSAADGASRAIPSRAPWFVAACLLGCLFAGTTWLTNPRNSSAQLSRILSASGFASAWPALPVDPPQPIPINISAISATGAEVGGSATSPAGSAVVTVVPLAATVGFIEPAIHAPSPTVGLPPGEELSPRSLPAAPAPLPRPAPARVEPAVAATLPARLPSDDKLVRDVLQRYRSAYEGLNAKSAQEVWPDVDAPALERAFDGLASQRLTFDECNVDLHGAIGTATCRGSLSYTPKTGSRELRVDARVWTFTLRKIDDAWQIDGARVSR